MVFKKKEILKENIKIWYNIKEGRDGMKKNSVKNKNKKIDKLEKIKNNKTIIVVAIILLVVLGSVIYYFTKDFTKEITLDNYFELRNKESNSYIFIYDDTTTSEEMLELVENVAKKERIMVKILDFSNINKADTEKFAKADDYTKAGVIIPMIMDLENGKIDRYVAGHINEEELIKFMDIKEK